MTDVEPVPASAGPRRVRARWIVAAFVCLGAVVWMLYAGLASNLVYLRPVSEAVDERDDQGDATFRMGGAVAEGTVVETTDGVTFDITEGGVTVAVVHHGDPPDLFDDGAPVVVEGNWVGEVFDSRRLLIRHGNEYSEYVPPDDTAESEAR